MRNRRIDARRGCRDRRWAIRLPGLGDEVRRGLAVQVPHMGTDRLVELAQAGWPVRWKS